MNTYRIVVVGGGIVGLATARELARRHPGAAVTVLEKEDGVGRHQTSHNRGVVHAGLYYAPGSLKAELCRRGRALLQEFCAEADLPYIECGKLVVARTPAEVAALDDIEARSRANQVPGLRRVDADGIRAIEPHAAGVAALHSPHTAIVDFARIARALAGPDSGFSVRTGFEVTALRAAGGEVRITGPEEEVAADRVVLCAGLQSDVLARRAGNTDGPAIVPFRGEYWRLVPERTGLVRGLIYPVPDPRYPFLGVHLTRRVDGGVDLGPNAVPALALEGYRRRDVDPAFVAAAVTSPALRRLARAHWRTGLYEMAGSLSKRVFVARAATLVPELRAADVVRAPAGVRAQAVGADGALLDDFRISRVGAGGRIVAVRNAPSPAASSCLAIAAHICDSMGD